MVNGNGEDCLRFGENVPGIKEKAHKQTLVYIDLST